MFISVIYKVFLMYNDMVRGGKSFISIKRLSSHLSLHTPFPPLRKRSQRSGNVPNAQGMFPPQTKRLKGTLTNLSVNYCRMHVVIVAPHLTQMYPFFQQII